MLIGPKLTKVLRVEVVFFKSKFKIVDKKNADYSLTGWRLVKIEPSKYFQRFKRNLETVSSQSPART